MSGSNAQRALKWARSDARVFGVIAAITGIYVLARAALVPLVHDECASVLWFVRPGEWLPFRAHWDANNHYLSSGIGVLFTRLFGGSMIAVRAGSVLAFVIYLWATWQAGLRIRDRLTRTSLWAALVLCPFLLDFFSLFRGYALELAGWMLALEGLLRCAERCSSRRMILALLGLDIATGAIVALLPVAIIVLVVVGALAWRDRDLLDHRSRIQQVLVFIVLGIIPLLICSFIALELRARGLLYHGTTAGFFEVTVRSLCRYVVGSSSVLVCMCVVVPVLLSSFVAVRQLRRSKDPRSAVVVVHGVLWADVLLRILLAIGLGVNFPEDRAALHFIPLVLLAVSLAIDHTSSIRPVAAWSALLILLLPARTLFTANLDHTLPWPEQSVPLRFMEEVAGMQRSSAHTLLVGAHHQLGLAWSMNAALAGVGELTVQTGGFPGNADDVRVADTRFLDQARVGYHAIDSAEGPGLWLLVRNRPWEITPVDTFRAAARSGTDEFMELAQLPPAVIRAHASRVQVEVPLAVSGPSPDLHLVLEVNDTTSGKLQYEAIAPLALRPVWTGESLRVTWGLSALPATGRAVVYLYNPERVQVALGGSTVILGTIRR